MVRPSFCSNHDVLICYNPQNGRTWVASNARIARLVLPRSCESSLHSGHSSHQFYSAFAAAYPDDVDERFAVHWYSCPRGALA